MAEQSLPQLTPEQRAVNEKYLNKALCTKADAIVKKYTTFQQKLEDSQYLISITKNSQVLIVMAGIEGLMYNSLSTDNINPWLINKFAQLSLPAFFEELNEYWAKNAQVPADWGIRPFRIYEWNENASKWEARDLEVDRDNKVVRVRVKDQEFWCHPPRSFQVLENACNKMFNNSFKQINGRLGKAQKDFQNVDTDETIPKDKKPTKKSTLEASIIKAVDDLYQFVEDLPWNDNTKLTSYRYPTLQMGADKNYQKKSRLPYYIIVPIVGIAMYYLYRSEIIRSQILMIILAVSIVGIVMYFYNNWSGIIRSGQARKILNRFGGDSSGVHRDYDNKVHYRFEQEGTEPIPKPTKDEFRIWVLNRHAQHE